MHDQQNIKKNRVNIPLNTQDMYCIHHSARGKIPFFLQKDVDNENATFDMLDKYLITITAIIANHNGMPGNTPQPNKHDDLRDKTGTTGNVNC